LIQVSHLSKHFNNKIALSDINFSVEKGEILGFLGPNGAGKTTTMRILTAFIPPTSGKVVVGGFDVTRDSLSARKLIGYLPEQVPLYPEMRVREYLKFRAQIKGLKSREIGKAIDRVIEDCQLKEVENKIIAHLSKGFRQRTGLADALINEPPILILDEPTIGLDPSQIRQTRELIKQLGSTRTLILSTHILPEVEQVCSRVLIINKGKIVGSGTPSELRMGLGGKFLIKAVIRGKDISETKIQKIEGIASVSIKAEPSSESKAITIATERAEMDIEENLFKLCVENGWFLHSLYREKPTMEDVFIELTKNEELA